MKKTIRVVLLLILCALLGYLFFWPADYIIRFKEKANVGTINQSIKLWDRAQDTVRAVEQEGDDLHQLSQLIKTGDSVHHYHWDIKKENDSLSLVKVSITDDNRWNSVMNRIQVPFRKTSFTNLAEKKILDFMDNLKDHTKRIKVTIVGEEEIPTKYIAYIPEKTTQMQKAGGMMKNFGYLTNELFTSGAQLNGPPMIEVTHWDRTKDSIHFNFGQPIIRSEKLPMGTDIQYKRIFGKRAIKAIYNGNYITSDRAWYAIMDYAEKEGIEVEPLPVEVFYNNPNTGGGEESWKAEVFMPIKETQE